jgi:hypothetical protein
MHEDTVNMLIVVAALVLAGLNAHATWLCLRHHGLEPHQKLIQVVLVWVVPVLGAVVVAGVASPPKVRAGSAAADDNAVTNGGGSDAIVEGTVSTHHDNHSV